MRRAKKKGDCERATTGGGVSLAKEDFSNDKATFYIGSSEG